MDWKQQHTSNMSLFMHMNIEYIPRPLAAFYITPAALIMPKGCSFWISGFVTFGHHSTTLLQRQFTNLHVFGLLEACQCRETWRRYLSQEECTRGLHLPHARILSSKYPKQLQRLQLLVKYSPNVLEFQPATLGRNPSFPSCQQHVFFQFLAASCILQCTYVDGAQLRRLFFKPAHTSLPGYNLLGNTGTGMALRSCICREQDSVDRALGYQITPKSENRGTFCPPNETPRAHHPSSIRRSNCELKTTNILLDVCCVA